MILYFDENTFGSKHQVITTSKVKVKCDNANCKKEWWCFWQQKKNRKRDLCFSCLVSLGITGTKNKKCSEETKKKISIANKGRNVGDLNPSKRLNVREKISNKLKGRKVYWLEGRKRPEHSKWMKLHWREFVGEKFLKGLINGNPNIAQYAIKNSKGHSKLHDNIHLLLLNLGNFQSEIRVGRYTVDEILVEKMIIIEVNGDKFHANPMIYKENDTPHPFRKELLAKQIWEYDNKRMNFLKELGYNVYIIWENDVKIKGLKEIGVCIQNWLAKLV
jgi:very-short-patch-repair endonuclease